MKATLEQSLNPDLITQRDKTIQELERHKDRVDDLITEIRNAQTLDEYLEAVKKAARSI